MSGKGFALNALASQNNYQFDLRNGRLLRSKRQKHFVIGIVMIEFFAAESSKAKP